MGLARVDTSLAHRQLNPNGESNRSQNTQQPVVPPPQATQPSSGPTQGGSPDHGIDDNQRMQLEKQLNKQRTPNTRPALPSPESGAGGVSLHR